MSLQSQTTWFYRNSAVLTADSPITGEWHNVEVLNGGQFFLKYSGVSNVGVLLHLSPAEARGNDVDEDLVKMSPADCYEEITALTSGANGSEGFFSPATPSIFDRPFRSFRYRLTLDANITACYFVLCSNAAAPG